MVLPDLDLSLDEDVWEELGHAGVAPAEGEAPFGREDALTHPQYHLKLLLNRMGVARAEVDPWHRAGPAAAPPERSKAISNLFLPAKASARWVDLDERKRRLSAVRLMESEHPGEEAQAIAILIRQALEEPERRVALVTPDRGLASRVVAHLQRWDIRADDTAGRPLPQPAAGRLLLLLAEVAGEGAPPVSLIALLGHPLVGGSGESRAAWLDHTRRLDLALRCLLYTSVSDERALLLETGGGMVKAHAAGLLPDPFFALNSDNIWLDGPYNTCLLYTSRCV